MFKPSGRMRWVSSAAFLALGLAFRLPATPPPLGFVVHDTGEGLSVGDFDPYWVVVLPDGTDFGNAISAIDPNGNWIDPGPARTWISIAADAPVPTGTYRYTTTFEIDSNHDAATATLFGSWWADEPQSSNQILLNDQVVSEFDGASWFDEDSGNAHFQIDFGFVQGVNTLTFVVGNTGGPSGIAVTGFAGFADEVRSVPEASPWLSGFLLSMVTAGYGWHSRRQGREARTR
ncbi:MAG: hypothetical protein JNK85_05410 [Verrucomicrobiales bacterium]|nr:hypothetical protein [Verrucomicrobiales bacterium]